MRRTGAVLGLLLSCILTQACGRAASPAPVAIRLLDLYEADDAKGRSAGPARTFPRTEWRFDGPAPEPSQKKLAATRGWEAGPGVAGLAVKEGRLVGRSATNFPLLHLERTSGKEDRDLLHAIEIRLRVSAGTNLSFDVSGAEKVELAEVLQEAEEFPWTDTTPILAGDQMRSYTLRQRRSSPSSEIRHLFLRPTDVAGATFEIESVRFIFRKEYLAGVPSGLGWHGLSEIYRESLVSRSPETISMGMSLPEHPWLDLAIGTLEYGPVTFKVGLSRAGGPTASGSPEEVLLEKTVTTPHRWEITPIDLSPFAGEKIQLSLSVQAEPAGALGFWGSPVVRSKGAMPVAGTGAPNRNGAEPPQGIILIWADTLRRDHLDIYGYNRQTTPVLRRMAAEGTLFSDCVAQATWTKVSTPSLLTSLYPTTHTVKEFVDRLPASAVTLAEVYRDAGYATLSMSSILFTGMFTNMHQGFEELHEDRSLSDRQSSKTSREYVDRLLPWLESHRDVPFFVFLHVSDPHDPYKPYPPYDTLWADAAKTEEHERQAKEVKEVIADPLLKLFGMPTRGELEKAGFDPEAYVAHDLDWYDGSIRAMDVEIGRLLEQLRTLDLDRKTLVVFTSDHGEEFLEHGRMFHGQTVYGELTNVPLLIWGPGAGPAGAVVDQMVRIIDVMPTLLELSGLPAPAGIQGESLVPLLAAGVRARPGISEKAAISKAGGGPPPRETESLAIVLEGWKLIHNPKRPQGHPEFELYDTHQDPLNRQDLAGQHPEILLRLREEMEKWRSQAAAARLKPDSAAAESMSAEELERLRSLGYIQ